MFAVVEQTHEVIVDASSDPEMLGRAMATFGAGGHDTGEFAVLDHTLAFVDVDASNVTGWCWGYVLRRPDAQAMAYLHELEVAEASRRRGIGSALVRAFAASAYGHGASKMSLITGENNRPARRIYDNLGGALASQGPTVNYWFTLPIA